MASPQYAITPSNFITPDPTTFIAANATAAKIVVEPQPEAAITATLPPFVGGATLLDLTATSTDAAAKDVLVYLGTLMTAQDATATGNVTLTAQNNLARVNGSWIADRWVVGDLLMSFAAPGTAQVATGIDGIVGTVTTVTALNLTVNGTPFAAGTNVLTAGTRLVNVSQLFRTTIAANSGNSATIPNVSLLGSPQDAAIIRTELKLGSTSFLIVAMQAAVAALPAFITLSPRLARY